jgi:hypothetical protein
VPTLSSTTGGRPALLEPWFAELDRLCRRRADNRPAIEAHVNRFLGATLDWEATTGESATRYHTLMRQRIDRSLTSPWPRTGQQTKKLIYARHMLGAAERR